MVIHFIFFKYKQISLAQQKSFVAQITTKLFCCGNKILVGQAKPFSTYIYIYIYLTISRKNLEKLGLLAGTLFSGIFPKNCLQCNF